MKTMKPFLDFIEEAVYFYTYSGFISVRATNGIIRVHLTEEALQDIQFAEGLRIKEDGDEDYIEMGNIRFFCLPD